MALLPAFSMMTTGSAAASAGCMAALARHRGAIAAMPALLASSSSLPPALSAAHQARGFWASTTTASASAPSARAASAAATLGSTASSKDGAPATSTSPAPQPHKGLHENVFPGPIYSQAYMESVRPTHLPIKTLDQRIGYASVQALRGTFDLLTGYRKDAMTETKWLTRIIFLESVAAVPGMVAGMLRHLRSLRGMKEDNGWIHTLLEEAENERQHLLTFLHLRQPGLPLRAAVLLTQGVFFNLYTLAYMISPRTCHSFVGYLEEEAVKTYTGLLEDVEAGRVWSGRPVPKSALAYWHLPPDATMRDLVLAVRADEACHGHVNHTLAHTQADSPSPFTNQDNVTPKF